MIKKGRATFILDEPVDIISYAAAVGKAENEGTLSGCFDYVASEEEISEGTWEADEGKLQKTALYIAMQKAGLSNNDITAVFAGDLLNQCAATFYGLRGYEIPTIGIYGACSTMAEALILAAMLSEKDEGVISAAVTSSHYETAERQYRFPIAYGGVRPPTAQWTATAAGAVLIGNRGKSLPEAPKRGSEAARHDAEVRRQKLPQDVATQSAERCRGKGAKSCCTMQQPRAPKDAEEKAPRVVARMQRPKVPKIGSFTIGIINDTGLNDANDMGSAMAYSAYDTIKRHFEETGTEPSDYDAIFTGDLGAVGSGVLRELFQRDNVDIHKVHRDCGVMLYNPLTQDVHAGGSGAGCSACVLAGHILPAVKRGELHRVLFTATGALMSPTMVQQGESIPGIAHLVEIRGQ